MRDRIQECDLSDELRTKINNGSEVGSQDLTDVNNKLKELENRVNELDNTIDMSNYYTKTDIDIKVPKLIESSVTIHNSDTNAHKYIQDKISELITKISSITTKTDIYRLPVSSDNQKVFTIEDSNYIAASVMSSVLVINGMVITDYTLNGKTITLSTTEGVTTSSIINIIIFSIAGV